jgi:hypothetical protein
VLALRRRPPLRDEVLRREEVAGVRAFLTTLAISIASVAPCSCASADPPRPTTDVVIVGPRVAPPREVEPGTVPPDDDGSVAPIAWADDPEGARERARLQGLPLLVFVKADWATASVEMERKVLVDPAVARAARPFIAIKIDATNDDPATIHKLGTFGVDGVPAIVMELPTTGRREIIASFIEAEDLARALNTFLSK